MPIKLRIVVQVQIESGLAGTVKIAGQGSEGALQVRRAARRVVPRMANLIAA